MLGVLTSAYAVGVSARFSMQILAFVQVMVASRYLGLAEFGAYALAWAVTVIANSFVYTGFYQALLRSTDIDRDRDMVFWSMAAIGGGGAVVIALSGLLGGVGTAAGFALLVLAPVPILRVIAAWNEAHLVRDQRIRWASGHVVISEACALLVVVLALQAGWGIMALIAARYTTAFVELFVTTALVRHRPRMRFSRPGFDEAQKTAWPLWATSGLGMFSNYGADLILGAFLNPAAVGAYRGGARISQTVTDLVMQPLIMLSWSAFTQLEKQGKHDQMQIAWQDNMRFGAVAMLPILACVALLSEEIVAVVFDETWLPAAPIVAILCLARGLRFMTALLEPTLVCMDQAGRQLRIRLIGAVLLLVCLLLFGRLSGTAASWAHVVSGLIVAVLSFQAMLPALNLSPRRAALAFVPGTVLTLVCALLVVLSEGWRATQSPAMGLALTVAVLTALWLGVVAVSLQRRWLVVPRP